MSGAKKNKGYDIMLVVYIVLLLLVFSFVAAVAFKYWDDLSEMLGARGKIDFTADMIKDKTFEKSDGIVSVYECDEFILSSNAKAEVYTLTYNDGEAVSKRSLKSEDGFTFSHLVVLNGSAPVWNLVNTTTRTARFDLYFTVTDGSGLKTQNDLYFAKSGEFSATESSVFVYSKDGAKLELTGDINKQKFQLGQPYKVSFELKSAEACVLNSSTNRLAIYGINYTVV